MISDKRYDLFIEEVSKLEGNNYTILRKPTNEEIKNDNSLNSKVLIRHNCDICNNNEYFIKPDKFISRNQRCPICYRNSRKPKKEKSSIKELKISYTNKTLDKFNKMNDGTYEIISEIDDIGYDKPVKLRHHCYDGYINDYELKQFSTFLVKNRRCKRCKNKKPLYTTEEIKQQVYDLVGDKYIIKDGEIYKGDKEKIKMVHVTKDNGKPCGYEFEVTMNNFKFAGYNRMNTGSRCPRCAGISSNHFEETVYDFIKSFYNGKIERNKRGILSKKHPKMELDIFIPDLKLAIECNGLVSHSEYRGKGKKYHSNKTLRAERKGIRLIHLFEDEWYLKNDICKSKIKHIMGYNNNKTIYARNCYIKNIDSKTKKEFLNKNHIQGNDKSAIKLGLFTKNDNVLVSVLTFGKTRFQKDLNDYDYELYRFASDINYRVVGAFSKLLNYFEKNYEWNKIVTYADRRWSTSNLYLINSFKLVNKMNSKGKIEYNISYSYINIKSSSKIRESRYKYQKKKLKNLFPEDYNENLSEKEIMEQNGFSRIYDCGNYVLEYSKNP